MRPQLHVITDEVVQKVYTHRELAQQAASNGADFIQYREKRAIGTDVMFSTATQLQTVCQLSGHARLIVNDRVDIGLSTGAAGVHLGKNDLPVSQAREILGLGVLIGGTANSLEQAQKVWTWSVDYLGVGPVFGTRSKSNPAPVLGLERLSQVCEASPVPVVAIGNIQIDNVEAVIQAGAAGIAVLSAIVCASDPGKCTREFMEALESSAR